MFLQYPRLTLIKYKNPANALPYFRVINFPDLRALVLKEDQTQSLKLIRSRVCSIIEMSHIISDNSSSVYIRINFLLCIPHYLTNLSMVILFLGTCLTVRVRAGFMLAMTPPGNFPSTLKYIKR